MFALDNVLVNMPNTTALTLQDLNNAEVLRRLPAMVFLGIIILFGIPGNILVVITYYRTYKRSAQRSFIIAVTVIDTVACVVSVPFEIVEMNFEYTFYATVVCKVFRCISTMTISSSNLILLALSVDRYRHVRHPFKKQMEVREARYCCGVVIFISAILSWPVLVLSGTRHVVLPGNITGYDCSSSDKFRQTDLPFIYEALKFTAFSMAILALIILYSLMGLRLTKQIKFRRKLMMYQKSCSSSPSSQITCSAKGVKNQENRVVHQHRKTSTAYAVSAITRKRTKPSDTKRTLSTRKITKIAFIISLMFVLCNLPNLVLNAMTTVTGRFVSPPGPVSSALLPIAIRSNSINILTNPITYAFCDANFRKRVRNLLLKSFR